MEDKQQSEIIDILHDITKVKQTIVESQLKLDVLHDKIRRKLNEILETINEE